MAAFLRCAAAHGIEYDGPFTDSTGEGIYFKLAEGQKPSRGAQDRVTASCPEGTVGLFGTPIGALRVKAFDQAELDFARCIRNHGLPNYPSPVVGTSDPVRSFWRLPFDWSNHRFVSAVKACVPTLRDYLFSS